MKHSLTGSLALIMLTACVSTPPAPQLPQTIELPVRDSARISSDLEIRFDQVASDSRCPIDVQCPTAGNAEIRLTLSGDTTQSVSLNTAGEPRSEVYNGYRIRLEALRPWPLAEAPIEADRYTVVLSIDEADEAAMP